MRDYDFPCPDDDEYPCEYCGEPTDTGYDDGVCAQCGGDDNEYEREEY